MSGLALCSPFAMLPLLVAGGLVWAGGPQQPSRAPASSRPELVSQFVERYCVDCHNSEDKTAILSFEGLDSEDVGRHPEIWEKVARKLIRRQMPPPQKSRPPESAYNQVLARLDTLLDNAADDEPNPGRTDALRRINRTEYQNVIRDLLALDIDAAVLLPSDQSSHGIDNVTVGSLSPTLLDRYITAAQRISRLAVGIRSAASDTIRVRPDITQEEHVDGLPPGTRGGVRIPYTFPQGGEYEVQIRLARDRNEHVEGLNEPHELEVLLDQALVASFTVSMPGDRQDHQNVDAHLKTRISVKAGPHQLGITFVKNPSSLLETKRQPYQAHFNMHRHPRISPAIYQVSITGPVVAGGHGDTPSRRRLFVREPTGPDDEDACGRAILSTLLRRAYRRPPTDADLQKPMELYRQARADGDFDAGIELALSAVLVNPQFLFRIETDPPGVPPNTAYHISDLELASRLSFFLWSSMPDDELLELAIRGELGRREVLEQQVRRMLADSRSQALASNFAGQWLQLPNLDSITPDLRLFPDFDDNLRQGFRRETELFFESVLREDRSVLDLLRSDYTFLNERLAKHYGVPHVYGSRFRRVALADDSQRGGLLRHGSVLTLTSYATRTSPVIRGKWVLENVLGSPPPPPPANVPALTDNTVSARLPIRERLAAHRSNAACARCHIVIDPAGFALENYDAVGRWRTSEEGRPVDATGSLLGVGKLVGVTGLEQALLDRPDVFVGTMSERLLTFALGRSVEYFDAPAIRKMVRDARADDYRFSSLILGIVTSTPFQMRKSE